MSVSHLCSAGENPRHADELRVRGKITGSSLPSTSHLHFVDEDFRCIGGICRVLRIGEVDGKSSVKPGLVNQMGDAQFLALEHPSPRYSAYDLHYTCVSQIHDCVSQMRRR
ncbi:hypothetical protein HAX54_002760 [Datura stramonium]|uniref:Uncharacterized protein n=1 Tax=Datura stramonium TaxID=4076 RepID=A0ABS8T5D9_DATST|nr:hypothetical protein [Datura stramonium]